MEEFIQSGLVKVSSAEVSRTLAYGGAVERRESVNSS